MGRLEGVRAVITGAASGIGEATTRLFLREGARVVMADIEDDRGKRIAAELGDGCLFVHADVSQDGALDAAAALAVSEFGGLDCFFNNAGNPGTPGGIEDIDLASFDKTLAIHVRGMFLGIRAAAHVMRPRGQGSIINTASVAAYAANLAPHDYSASKAAILQLTKTAANELGEDGIRVNAICPGAIATAIYGRGVGLEIDAAQRTVDAMAAFLSDVAPIRRSGTPLDVAEAALWLASDASSFVNGQAIIVDGGLMTGPLRRRQATDLAGARQFLYQAAGEPIPEG